MVGSGEGGLVNEMANCPLTVESCRGEKIAIKIEGGTRGIWGSVNTCRNEGKGNNTTLVTGKRLVGGKDLLCGDQKLIELIRNRGGKTQGGRPGMALKKLVMWKWANIC